MKEKFLKEDRELVVQELEKIQKSSLNSIKPFRKLYRDEEGRYYCIFGGVNNWHGISHGIMKKIKKNPNKTLLVVAKKYRTRIDVCVGIAEKLLSNINNLPQTKTGGFQFHVVLTENGLYFLEIPDLKLPKISEIILTLKSPTKYELSEIKKIVNIDLLNKSIDSENEEELTHSDIQAKIILIGNLLGYRTFTPDKSKESRYGILGELCTEKDIPTDYIPPRKLKTVKYIDVMWFDYEGLPTHCFEVEHTTDVTKGLLRLYQIRKLKIRMFIIATEESRKKFDTELQKDPFYKIKEEYIFRTYPELKSFFDSVKKFVLEKGEFLNEE
jgi:hypothetical protein